MLGLSNGKSRIQSCYQVRSAVQVDTSFNFSPTSENYIRKAFNTNPTLTNADITDSDQIFTGWVNHMRTITICLVPLKQVSMVLSFLCLILPTTLVQTLKFLMPTQPLVTLLQDLQSTTGTFDAKDQTRIPKLFRLRARTFGDGHQETLKFQLLIFVLAMMSILMAHLVPFAIWEIPIIVLKF